jgi:AhpD family alkylhydroperoxidase
MRDLLGTVPCSFDRLADEFVDSEWDLMKRMQFGETLIPNRYKELIGVAVAAVTRCPYATRLHTEVARLHGATEAEVAEAVHYAALVSAWSTQLSGLAPDPDGFAAEVDETVRHLARRMGLDS